MAESSLDKKDREKEVIGILKAYLILFSTFIIAVSGGLIGVASTSIDKKIKEFIFISGIVVFITFVILTVFTIIKLFNFYKKLLK
jgi:heme/copper-type cytochrome/quinol oxidase subunit 3